MAFAFIAIFALPAAAQVCINPVFPTQAIACTSYVDYLPGKLVYAVTVAVADFNRDGKLDLVVAENGFGGGDKELIVQLGNGDGTFQAGTILGTCCIDANWAVPGDFNGDGNPDIATSSGSGTVTIWLGDGTGNFTLKEQFGATPCCGAGPRAGAVGDFNGDGILDLVIINNNASPGVAQIYLGNGDGTFNTTASAVVSLGVANQNSPISVTVGDFNHDGHLDFATVNSGCCTDSISVALGIGDGTFQTAVNYPVANGTGNAVNGISIVTADFNHDTYLDLATLEPGTNGGILAVFLNNGNGTFGTPVFYSAQGAVTDPQAGVNLAVGDFNKDGNPDLVFATNWRGGAGVVLGNPDGTFGQPKWYVTDVSSNGVATGDFNGDGNPDFVVSSDNNTVTVALGNGDGTFKSARNYVPFNVSGIGCYLTSGVAPSAIAFGDFNGDGKPDMAVAGSNFCYVAIYLNNGDGTYTESATYQTNGDLGSGSIVAADVNRDGKLDLVLSTGQTSFLVLLGNGDGSLQAPVSYSNGTGAGTDTLVVADVNGDGKLDVISDSMQTISGQSSFYVNLGNGDGTFQSAVATLALCPGGLASGAVYLAIGDLNGDGKPDIVGACHANLHLSTVSVLLGKGDGTFGPPSQFASGGTPVSIAIADYNEDGKPDIAVANNSPTPQFSVMLGNGDGTFQSPASTSIYPNGGVGWGWPGPAAYPSPDSIVAADFNRDGHLDLLVGDGYANQQTYNGQGSYNIGVQLFLGNGNGTFQPVQNYLGGRNATSLAVADLNGDGLPDVGVVSSLDSSVNVLLSRFSNPSTVLLSITVSPNPASVPAGLTQQFTATGNYLDGSVKPLTALVTWSSSNTGIATIDSAGLATGVAQGGPVTITAALNGISGTAPLTVTAPALQSITVSPASASVAAGLTQQFNATGHYSDGSTQSITSSVRWSSSNTAIATIRITGVARGVSVGGPVTITGSLDLISGMAQLTVTAPLLVSIAVTPANPSVLAGSNQQITATGTYTDGSAQNLAGSVTWASSNTSIATISTSGLALARSNGSTTISASTGGVSGRTTMTVVTLQSLTIAPLSATIFAGSKLQFTATGHYSDGSAKDLTSSAQWTSSKPLTASITPSGGLATGLNNGATTITATFHNMSASTTLNVNAVLLQSITVTPASVTIPAAGMQQFTAIGHYNDGSTQDLTNIASWSLAPKWVAGISSTGLAAGFQPAAGLPSPSGTATVNAKWQGVVGSATLTVLP